MLNWKGCIRERSWANLIYDYYPGISLEGQRKTAKTLSQDSWFLGPDFIPELPEYEAAVITIRPRNSAATHNSETVRSRSRM